MLLGAMQRIAYTALNNHAGKWSCSRPSQALSTDKWACPSIEIVGIQLATSAGAGP